MADTGPPIDGLDALAREISDLKTRIRALETGNGRTIPIGTTFRFQVRAGTTGAGAILDCVRSDDGNTVQINP